MIMGSHLPAAQEVVQHADPRLCRRHAVQTHRVHAPVDLGQDAHLPRVRLALRLQQMLPIITGSHSKDKPLHTM